MTMQEQMDLWNELVKQICEFRRECMEEFKRQVRESQCGEVAD